MSLPATAQPVAAGGHDVTVLEGSTFCRSDADGDIAPQQAQGVFVKDTRVVSTWRLLFDGDTLSGMGVLGGEGFWASFVGRSVARRGREEPHVVVERHRLIGSGMREDITVFNYGTDTLEGRLELEVAADFADLFEVKDGRPRPRGTATIAVTPGCLDLSVTLRGRSRGVRVRGDGEVREGGLSWDLSIPAQGSWRTTVHAVPTIDGEEPEWSFPDDHSVVTSAPALRLRQWREALPVADCESGVLQRALEHSLADIGSLRISDPHDPEVPVIAAGAPWFMTLFGRDSILTSLFTLPWDPHIARGTLRALARLQGVRVDDDSEQEPGKILHEVREGLDESVALGGNAVYYGSIDATPLFVVLLTEAARWGLAEEEVRALLPAADRALAWIEEYGDVDGDGFVEYARKTERGLANQGWKDSFDSISDLAGHLAEGPIALAEVQGYVYAAYRGRAHVATMLGDAETAARCDRRARRLRDAFEEAFWLPEHGYYALALDGRKRPVDALASNQGHCLWAGIVSPERAEQVAARLVSPRLFSGWGVRTLGVGAARFNPVSYHNGSVWPHDNALSVLGLMRYGHVGAAQRVAAALLEASVSFSGRLPELFCGFDRDDVRLPVGYPTACSPQAWAAATPLALLTALLWLRPDAAAGVVHAVDALPEEWGRVRLSGLRVGERRVDLDSGALSVRGPAKRI